MKKKTPTPAKKAYPEKYTVLNPDVEFHETLAQLLEVPHYPNSQNKVIQLCVIQHPVLKKEIQQYEKFQSDMKKKYDEVLKKKDTEIAELKNDLETIRSYFKLQKKLMA